MSATRALQKAKVLRPVRIEDIDEKDRYVNDNSEDVRPCVVCGKGATKLCLFLLEELYVASRYCDKHSVDAEYVVS